MKAVTSEFKYFNQAWSKYSGEIDVWQKNFINVEQLFNYGSAVRKIIYTTNEVESINSSLRKVTRKGSFHNENAVLKLLYLRVMELQKNGMKNLLIIGRL
ncbi:transposase [Paraclostridium ghonii]|uniref:transposase n=1 Tax=Paraclostridium ghonii TaxID=29358 RepID=UPI00202CE541|nr:transposase [Paeniclostridium ghonii]MCM0165633.1 transposase [Paeniclostridium ghonii]